MPFGDTTPSLSAIPLAAREPVGKYPRRLRFAILVGSSTLLWALLIAGGWSLWALI